MNEDNEEYEETEYEDTEYEQVPIYPEELPQASVNVWDIARILFLPLAGLAQGTAKMVDQGYGLLIHLSEQHDAKKAAEEMEKALK